MPVHDWTRVDAGLFHHFHQGWIGALCDALNAGGLPRGYYALLEPATSTVPMADVLMLQHRVHTAAPEWYSAKSTRIAVHHSRGDVVAVVEFVSPGNKNSPHSLWTFVDKMVGFLNQGIHVLVVDLFPASSCDPQGIHKAIWDEFGEHQFELPSDKPLTLVAYTAGITKEAYVEPAAVGDSLLDMPLFLAPDSYVAAPLEATYRTTWAVCPEPMKALLEPPTS